MRKTPSSSSTMAWWWRRSVVIQQGFAKHRGRGEGREVGLRQEGEVLVCWAAPRPHVFIGGGEGAAPPLGFPPQGWRQPPDAIWWRPEGGRGEAHLGWALGPICPRVCPPPTLPCALGLVGGAPAHLGLVPSHTWPMQPSGVGGPTWWTPGTLPVVPVRYRKNPKLFR